jgi:hypothetical protein
VNATEVKVAQCDAGEETYLAFATEFTSSVYVQVDMEPDTVLTDQNLNQIGEWFQEEYNAANEIQWNASSFQLVAVKPYSANPFSYILRNEDSTTFLPYEVVGYCSNCDGDTLIFNNRTAPKDDILALYSPYFGTGITLVDVVEVQVFPCGNVLTRFEKRVVVDFVIDCTELPAGINDPVFDIIAEAYVSSFQTLHEDYCDKEMVSVNSAKVIEMGDIREDNTLPLELLLEMQCLGCDTETTGAYSVPGGDTTARRYLAARESYSNPTSRLLEDTNGACACTADPLAERSPTEAEFIELYQATLSDLTLGCISTTQDCSYGEGIGIDTAAVISFDQNRDFNFDEEFGEILAKAFKDTVNELLRMDNSTCDLFFHTIEDVRADIEFIYNNRNPTLAGERERILMHESWHRKIEESILSSSPSAPPSAAPSVSSPPSASAAPSVSSSPSTLPSVSSSPSASAAPSVSSSPSTSPSVSSSPSASPSVSLSPSASPSVSQAPSEMPSESHAPSTIPSSMPTVTGSGFVFVLLYITGVS